MTEIYTEQQVIAEVPGLNRTLLVRFIEAEIILPVQRVETPAVTVFAQLDVARLRLACDLCECFDLEDEALAMVMGLVDQLHGVRGELRSVLRAIETLPPEKRREIGTTLQQARNE